MPFNLVGVYCHRDNKPNQKYSVIFKSEKPFGCQYMLARQRLGSCAATERGVLLNAHPGLSTEPSEHEDLPQVHNRGPWEAWVRGFFPVPVGWPRQPSACTESNLTAPASWGLMSAGTRDRSVLPVFPSPRQPVPVLCVRDTWHGVSSTGHRTIRSYTLWCRRRRNLLIPESMDFWAGSSNQEGCLPWEHDSGGSWASK